MSSVYLVVEHDYEGSNIHRAYLDKEEAEAYADAYNQTSLTALEVEEQHLGRPDVEYDGPLYTTEWTTRRKLKGERQLILQTQDGLTMVVPSAVPRYEYFEMFTTHPRPAPEYEHPPVWIDSVHSRSSWREADDPGAATVIVRDDTRVVVHGTDRAAVEALCRAMAVEVKQEMGL